MILHICSNNLGWYILAVGSCGHRYLTKTGAILQFDGYAYEQYYWVTEEEAKSAVRDWYVMHPCEFVEYVAAKLTA